MNLDVVREYAELTQVKRSLERDLKAAKDKLEELMPLIIDEFADDQLMSLKLATGAGSQTVFLTSTTRARNLINSDATAEAFKENGLGHMVRQEVNHNTLSSYVRNLEEAGLAIPEPLQEYIEAYEEHKVGVRQS